MQGFMETKGSSGKEILFASSPMMSVGIVVNDKDVTAGANGKKIVKAGTPLSGDLTARLTPFKAASLSNSATGILLHDVDVTNGSNNGTLVIFGYINLEHLDDDVAALITEDVKTALDKKVTFLK